jgi:hypothetical protein
MREKSMVPECDRESARAKHREEKCDLKPVDTKEPKIQGHCRDRQKQRADEKRANEPIDSVKGNLCKHNIGRLLGGRSSGSAQ